MGAGTHAPGGVRILLSAATALLILAVALMVLFTPPWTHFAISAAAGYGDEATRAAALVASDRTIAALLTFGAFDFPGLGQTTLYSAQEQGHMRDVRLVLYAFLSLALMAALFAGCALRRWRHDAASWRAVGRGAAGLVVSLVVLGAGALVAFDLLFELFHRIFFPGGNWAFSADSSLIRLYPVTFWQLSTAALGVLAVAGGGAVWWLARRRAAALTG